MVKPIQGLRVSLQFADSQEPIQVLRNLNLDIEDLDVIRGINDVGVESSDIRTLSGLEIDLEKKAIAIYNETRSYQNVLSIINDGRRRIGGNLDISGSIVAPTFKFRTVNFDSNNEIVTVDFSTSRSSAWSAFGDPEDSVFYGGDVVLEGSESTIELSSIEFASNPIEKRFKAQIPTHKIRVEINGEEYDLYTMKGIPIQFRGFFRSVRNLRVDYNILGNIEPSWIIRNRNTNQEIVFEDRSSGSGPNRESRVSVFDSRQSERDIEFYYPVDSITRIDLNQARIFELPAVKIPNLNVLNIVNGDLIEMPEIGNLYPNIVSLDLSRNDLTRSDNTDLRTFSPEVVDRLKTPENTLERLILDGVYSNECTADLGELTELTTFRADGSGTNSRRMRGTTPEISTGENSKMTSYNVAGNNFTSLANTVAESVTLRTLNIRSNSIGGQIDTSGDNLKNIETFITGGRNTHEIIDMSGKQFLRTYRSDRQTFPSSGNVGTEVFNDCPLLETIRIQRTNVTGALPVFETNTSLEFFASWSTRWTDAAPGEYSIGENTFGTGTTGGCRQTLEYFNLQSRNLSGPMHPQAFRNMTSLRTLVVRSYNRGITGVYPESIADCFNLRTLRIDRNQMNGQIPNFASNSRLVTINLSQNNFSGSVPSISLPNLRRLFLQRNELTSLGELNCPRLVILHVSFNNLQQFPDLEGAFRIQRLLLSNNGNMSYLAGSLEFLTALRQVEIANCGFNRGTVDQILVDLNENYNRNPRSNVSVSLIGNSTPSSTQEITSIINRLRREGWTLGLE